MRLYRVSLRLVLDGCEVFEDYYTFATSRSAARAHLSKFIRKQLNGKIYRLQILSVHRTNYV